MKTSASLNMALSGDPMSGTSKALIFKSIMSPDRLAECFQEAIRHTVDGKVHMETASRRTARGGAELGLNRNCPAAGVAKKHDGAPRDFWVSALPALGIHWALRCPH